MSINVKKSSLYNTFYDFLDSFRIKNENEKITHTSWGKIMGKYHIPDDKLDIFFDLYRKEIFENDQFGKLNIIEQHSNVSPIIIDIDFKFKIDISTKMKRLFNFNHIKKIVKIYIDEILDTFIFKNKSEQLLAFVFTRNNPYECKGNIKDGIHIMFPFIISEPNIQYIIRDKVIEKIKEDNTISDIPFENPLNDVFDRSVIYKNGWFMYGSSKPNCEPYKLSYIFDNSLELVKPDEVNYDGINDFAKFLSIRRYVDADVLEINTSKFSELDKLSKKQISFQINKMKRIHNESYNIKHISQLVEILSDDRYNNYYLWRDLGLCLHNIDSNNIELLNIWINFSKKWLKFKDGECEKLWNSFHIRNGNDALKLGSLFFWAKKDNPQKFIDIRRQDIRYWIDKSMNCTNYDVARVLYEMYKYDFKFVDPSWFEYKGHRWVNVGRSGITLRNKISEELVREYGQIVSDYNEITCKISMDDSLSTEDKDKEINKYEEKTKILVQIMTKLKTTSFKENIMKECSGLFYDKEFYSKLDDNNFLIGFENGVYDLKLNEFRDGQPEDYISLSTKINYIKYDENNPYVDEVKDFITKVLPIYSVREYVMKVLASSLQGHNAEEKFRIFIGNSGNGKSKIMELNSLALGQYADSFPVTLFTGKRASSNSASPEIEASKGKRLMQIDEPEEGAAINVGLMKQFSGGDKIKARGLFKDPIEFKPQFKMILIVNDLPKLPSHEGGTWRRVEAVEFVAKFVTELKGEYEYEYLRDENLSVKFNDWKETYMSILLEYYKMYKKEGVLPPSEVTKFTLEYQKLSDMYAEFTNNYLERSNISLTDLSDLYKEFKIWTIENNPNSKPPTKMEFKKYIEKKFGKTNIHNDYLKGYKIIDYQNKVKNSIIENSSLFDDVENKEDNITTTEIEEIEIT